MMWTKRLTPFRIAIVLFLGYQIVGFISTPSNFSTVGGSAWGSVAMITLLFWGALFWLADFLMRRSIKDWRIVWAVELFVIAAMYLFLDW